MQLLMLTIMTVITLINGDNERCVIYVLSKLYTGVSQRANHVSGVHEMDVVCTQTKHNI